MKDWQKYGLIYVLAYYLSTEVRTLTRRNFLPLANLLDSFLFPTPGAPTVPAVEPGTVPGFAPEDSDGYPGTLDVPGIGDVLGE